jgi:EAL domain-containing protein (putative c-di-GMP-specific phosphodiesterase class I)
LEQNVNIHFSFIAPVPELRRHWQQGGIATMGPKLRRHAEGTSNPLDIAVANRDRSVLSMVRQAVDTKQVLLAFQPVVQSRRPDRVAFYEALIRVMDETGRIIPAKDFMHAIEETETGRIMDCLSLEKGLRALSDEASLGLSVNMSARSIGYPRWMRTLNRFLDRDPLLAERLILEITESSAMLVPELVVAFMADLHGRGISFALDDIGAGYTAFRFLKQFQFDILKIDGQFIRGIADDPDNQALTNALVSIGQHFDMFTVAEFVERPQDADWLAAAGVDCLQGYYFAAPTVSPPWKQGNPSRMTA